MTPPKHAARITAGWGSAPIDVLPVQSGGGTFFVKGDPVPKSVRPTIERWGGWFARTVAAWEVPAVNRTRLLADFDAHNVRYRLVEVLGSGSARSGLLACAACWHPYYRVKDAAWAIGQRCDGCGEPLALVPDKHG